MAKSQDMESPVVHVQVAAAREWAKARGYGLWFEDCPLIEPAKRTAADILDDAIDLAEKSLAGIELISERDAASAFDAYLIDAQCPHCGSQKTSSWLTQAAIEDVVSVAALAEVLRQGARNVMAKCYAECIKHDPMKAAARVFADGAKAASEAAGSLVPVFGAATLACTTPVYSNTAILGVTKSRVSITTCAMDAIKGNPIIQGDVGIDLSDGSATVAYTCKACRLSASATIRPGDDAKAMIDALIANVTYHMTETQSFGDRHWCSQCPQEERMYDGLTSAECLARYEAWQREDSGSRMKRMRDGYLTREQMLAAQAQWSAELKKRQAAAREKERVAVVCDWQDEP